MATEVLIFDQGIEWTEWKIRYLYRYINRTRIATRTKFTQTHSQGPEKSEPRRVLIGIAHYASESFFSQICMQFLLPWFMVHIQVHPDKRAATRSRLCCWMHCSSVMWCANWGIQTGLWPGVIFGRDRSFRPINRNGLPSKATCL